MKGEPDVEEHMALFFYKLRNGKKYVIMRRYNKKMGIIETNGKERKEA